jgi:hypothetical protein
MAGDSSIERTDGSPQPAGRKNVRMKVGGFKREKNDFYSTPPVLTLPMLRLERFEGAIWEPACGDGAMSRELAKVSDKVISTDLIYRNYGEGDVDFLKQDRLRAPNIVTNPPFKLWLQFAKHAHRLGAQKIVLLNKLSILGNKTHSKIMFETGITRVLIARGRVDILPPGAEDKGFGSRHGNYAWFIWERGHTGEPTIQWFTPAEGDGDR